MIVPSGGAVPQRAQPAQHPEDAREDADGKQESVRAAERPPSSSVLSLPLSFPQPPRTTAPSSEASTPPPRPTPRPSAGEPLLCRRAAWRAACFDPAVCSCSILRHALDKVAEIKSLLEERRIGSVCSHSSAAFRVGLFSWLPLVTAAKMAGVYSDSDPPRKTMRRGVLMTLLQQSAMTLPLWIGKPGER